MSMTQSSDPIVVSALRREFPGATLGPFTGGFACDYPVPETGDDVGIRELWVY